MIYNGRKIELGEKVLIFGEGAKNITASYVRDEKIEITTPIFKHGGEEIRGHQCWWMPQREAEELKEEANYDIRALKFNKERGTSKK